MRRKCLIWLTVLGVVGLIGCGEDEVSSINITADNVTVSMKLYGWWANSDTAQIVTFSAGGGSYQSDFPSIWIQFPKQAVGSYSEGTPNVELQYWDEFGTFFRSENRGACNITITGIDPLTGSFGGSIYSSAMIKKELNGNFNVLTGDYQGIR